MATENSVTLLDFRCDCICPTATAQQKGAFVGSDRRVHFFTKPEVRRAAHTWWNILAPAKEALGPAITGPVSAVIEMDFPYLKSTPRRDVRLGARLPMGVRPDIDNLIKSLLDTMSAMGFWADDGQLYGVAATKRRGPTPGLRMRLRVPEDSPTRIGRTQTIVLDTRAEQTN